MMLEADVSLGKLLGDLSGAEIAIMAHPPITKSDLSLEDFLDTVIDYSKPKGIKLDIKSIDVLEYCLKAIEQRIDRVIFNKFCSISYKAQLKIPFNN